MTTNDVSRALGATSAAAMRRAVDDAWAKYLRQGGDPACKSVFAAGWQAAYFHMAGAIESAGL